MAIRRRRLIVFFVIALALVGCDGGNGSLVPVRGTVEIHDAPLATGTIVFVPDESRGNSGPLAQAEIQTDGSFQLHTGDVPGVAPGWYRVTVVAVDRRSADVSLLPRKYSDPDLSGLSCEIHAGKENGVRLRLD